MTYSRAYLLALKRAPRREMREAAHVLAGTGKQEWPWTGDAPGAQEAWCWLLTAGLIRDVLSHSPLRVEARWPTTTALGYVNIFDALAALERDAECGALIGVEIRSALRDAGLWQAPSQLSQQSDALAHRIELAIQKAGRDKLAVVWMQLQAWAASPNAAIDYPPLLRLDKNDDIVYRDANGHDASLSRGAVKNRLIRRRARLAKAR